MHCIFNIDKFANVSLCCITTFLSGNLSDDGLHLHLSAAAAAARLPERAGARPQFASEQLLRRGSHTRDEETLLQPAGERREFSADTLKEREVEVQNRMCIKLSSSPDIRRHGGGSETSGQILDH